MLSGTYAPIILKRLFSNMFSKLYVAVLSVVIASPHGNRITYLTFKSDQGISGSYPSYRVRLTIPFRLSIFEKYYAPISLRRVHQERSHSYSQGWEDCKLLKTSIGFSLRIWRVVIARIAIDKSARCNIPTLYMYQIFVEVNRKVFPMERDEL